VKSSMQMATGNLKVQATSRQMHDAHTDISLQLNQINLKPITGQTALSEGKLTFSDALQYFAEHSHANIIISSATSGKRSSEIIYRDSWAFQLNAVRKKALYAYCPLSGRLVESAHSLLANINTPAFAG
jgi:hypothetical protein